MYQFLIIAYLFTLVEKYAKIIEDQLKQGIIVKVRPEVQSNDTIKHYIPHHAVINTSKASKKVRIVNDAPAKTRPENSSLYRGPIMLQIKIKSEFL